MKQLMLCLITLMVVTGTLCAQPYQPVLQNISGWNILVEIPDFYQNDSLRTAQDTMVNGVAGKVVYLDQHTTPAGYISEDTLAGKLWYNGDLIMDLSLAAGDSFLLKFTLEPDIYTPVDSVYFVNGRKRIRFAQEFDIAGKLEKLTFIEGVGPNRGLMYQKPPASWQRSYLLCKYSDGIQVYANTDFNGVCRFFWQGMEERVSAHTWSLAPNPFTGVAEFNIQGLREPNYNLQVFNAYGQLVLDQQNLTTTSTTIDGSALAMGLYFFRASHDGKQIASGKFIRN